MLNICFSQFPQKLFRVSQHCPIFYLSVWIFSALRWTQYEPTFSCSVLKNHLIVDCSIKRKMFHIEARLKLGWLNYSFSGENVFIICSVTGMWCSRTKSAACCRSLFFAVLCCGVNFNWDNTLRVLVYSSEGVWIQVPVRSNEWKHQPVWQQTVYDSDSCSSLRTGFCNTLKSGGWGGGFSFFSSIMDPGQALSSHHTKLHLHLLRGVPVG